VDEYVDKINAVTPQQIQKVAQKYLIDDHLSIAYLEPLPIPEGAKQPEEQTPMGGEHVR
jgi:zinc protease